MSIQHAEEYIAEMQEDYARKDESPAVRYARSYLTFVMTWGLENAQVDREVTKRFREVEEWHRSASV